MKRPLPWLSFIILLGLILSAACAPAVASAVKGDPTIENPADTQLPTEAPALPSSTPSPQPSPTASATEAPPAATETATAPPPTPCTEEQCVYPALFLARPIDASENDRVDVTYRFGNTQGERREPHHGVEFLNPYGTPVLAAADGVVVVAGTDHEPASAPGEWPVTYFGPLPDFYGNLVVIEHAMPDELLQAAPNLPSLVYTLYAHLSEVLVSVGQQVQAGQQIGKVGMSGVAQGPHLHFEVRLGENSYQASRNPELWLAPHAGQDGQLNGAMAGSFIDSYGNNLPKNSIVLEHLPNGPDQPNDLEIHLLSYEEQGLIGVDPWKESFGVGDIPAGLYRLSFPHFGLKEVLFTVYPGQLTVVSLRVE